MTHFNIDAFTHFLSEGEVMNPYSRPSVSQSYVLDCADGKRIALHLSSPEKFWTGLVDAADDARLSDERFRSREGRIEHQEALMGVLQSVFARRDRAAWCALLEARDVPHAPVYDTSEALHDPQAKHLQLEISAPHATLGIYRTVRSPVSYDRKRPLELRPPPMLDEHGPEIRSMLKQA
jgi:crotonobetainyl-CoA:carnitine CoA-transferase CaiB-like acyl-CoA transferase